MHIFGTDIDLNRNQAKNFRLENGIALPTVGASDSGLTFYHSGLSKFYGWTGSTWIDFGSGGGGGGSTTFVGLTDTPSNFTGSALKIPRVNLGETALEFYLPPIKAEDQGGGIGYAWANRNEAFYATLGANSLDLTFATSGTDYGIASTDGFSFGYTNKLPLAGNSFGGHVAFGFDNTVTGYYGNISMGGDNTLNSGYTCMQVGYQNVGNWSNSIGMGYQFGTNNTSSSYFNVSAGSGLTNNWVGSTMVGAANVIDPATSTAANRPAFTVGIGTLSVTGGSVGVPTSRKDGFMVRYNSEILAPNTTIAIIDAETTGKQLVTKEWVNNKGYSVVTPVTWTPTGTGLNLTFNESYYIDYGTHLEMQVNGFWTASNPGAGTGSVNLPAGLTVRNRVSGKIVGASVGNPETNVTPGAIGAKHDAVSDTLLGLVMDQTYNGAMTYRFSIVIKIEV